MLVRKFYSPDADADDNTMLLAGKHTAIECINHISVRIKKIYPDSAITYYPITIFFVQRKHWTSGKLAFILRLLALSCDPILSKFDHADN
jgi:hypothetical protein